MIKSTKLTGIVMNIRDQLKTNVLKLRVEAEETFAAAQTAADIMMADAKKKRHASIISANKMEREADIIQEALNSELEMEVADNNSAFAAWDVKSQAKLAAEMDIDLIDCVNGKGK